MVIGGVFKSNFFFYIFFLVAMLCVCVVDWPKMVNNGKQRSQDFQTIPCGKWAGGGNNFLLVRP